MFANNLRSYAARTPLSLLWFLSFFLLCALGSPVGPRETLAFVDSSPEAKPFETVPPSPSAGGHCRLLVIPVYVLHNKSSVSHPCLTHSHQLQHTGDVPIGTVSRLPSCLLMPVGDNFARLQSPVACAPTHLSELNLYRMIAGPLLLPRWLLCPHAARERFLTKRSSRLPSFPSGFLETTLSRRRRPSLFRHF